MTKMAAHQAPEPQAGRTRAIPDRKPDVDLSGLPATAGNQVVSRALDPAVRASMEAVFGVSFADVQLHTDVDAERLGASAFTVGRHVAFAPGQYQPGTVEGRMLIAHELAHVVQQRSSSQSGATATTEAEASNAAISAALGGRVAIRTSAPTGVARAEKGYLERARELKDQAFAKAREIKDKALAQAHGVEQRVAAATQAALLPAAAEPASAQQAQAAAPPQAKRTPPPLKAQAKGLGRDVVKGWLGTGEGIWLEAANLLDTGVWAVSKLGDAEDLAFGSLDAAAARAGLGEGERKALTATARGGALIVSGGTIGMLGPATKALRDVASRSPIDPVTGQPVAIDPITKAPMVSGLVTKLFDQAEGVVDDTGVFTDATPDDSLLTAREKGQIFGSVGSQTVLAVVGGEEVALALKIAAAAGAAKNIEVAALRNRTDADSTAFVRAPEFWMAVGNLVLFVAGLRAARAGRTLLTLFVDAAMLGLATVPPVLKLAHDLQHAQGPDRDKVLHEDIKHVVRAGIEVIRQIVLHQASRPKGAAAAQAPKGLAEPTPEPAVLVKVIDGHPYRPTEPPPRTPELPIFPIHEPPKPAVPPTPAPSPPVPAPKPPPRPRRIDPSPFKEAPDLPTRKRPDFEIDPRFRKPPILPDKAHMPPPMKRSSAAEEELATAPAKVSVEAEVSAPESVSTPTTVMAGAEHTPTSAVEPVQATAGGGGGRPRKPTGTSAVTASAAAQRRARGRETPPAGPARPVNAPTKAEEVAAEFAEFQPPDPLFLEGPAMGGRPQPVKRDTGSFVHGGPSRGKGGGNAEALRTTPVGHPTVPAKYQSRIGKDIILLCDLPDGLGREVWLGPTRRADRVSDAATAIVYEIKPNTVSAIDYGIKQVGEYVRLLNSQKKPGQPDWTYKIVIYDQDAAIPYVAR